MIGDAEDFRIAARFVRTSHGRAFVDISVLRVPSARERLEIEDVTHSFQHLDAKVLVLRIKLNQHDRYPNETRISQRYVVNGYCAFRFVAVMHGDALIAVSDIEEGGKE